MNESEYNGPVQRDHGKTKLQVWRDNLSRKRIAAPADLNLMLMRSSRPLKVGRNGITANLYGAKLEYYTDEFTMQYQGKKVYYRYDPDDLTGESGTGICLIGNSEVYSRMLGKQEAQFAQQFSRVRFRRRYSTADVKLADVEKLFPTLADGSHGKELAFMTGVCRSKWGIRGAMSVYTNAVRNENTSLDGLRGIAASMGVGVLS